MDVDFFSSAKDVVLEVEVNPKGCTNFEGDYALLTGVTPVVGDHYQLQPNKWGRELRVYFNTTEDLSDEFTNIGVYVEEGGRPYRGQWRYRINDREFFWAVVRAGYRLGIN